VFRGWVQVLSVVGAQPSLVVGESVSGEAAFTEPLLYKGHELQVAYDKGANICVFPNPHVQPSIS